MKTGRTLQELAIELERQVGAKRDFVVGTQSMDITEAADRFRLFPDDEPELSFDMSDLFHRQMGASLGIPAKYYDKMRSEYPSLLSRNVNGWLRHEPSTGVPGELARRGGRHTVRTLDGTARAFLSDRYRRIDNIEIAQATLPVIAEMSGARIESADITETRMFIKVVNTKLEAEVSKGDVIQAGIVISNSEVGLGSVSVMPLVYRLVCANGMVINDMGKRKYHIGRELEESWELYSDATLEADDTAFLLKLRDIVRTAVDEARFAQVVDKLREAAGVEITGHIPNVVELTARQYGFNKTEQNDILQHLIQGGDLSLYGLSSAVTRASQDVESYDRATALEGAGWEIATMQPNVWRTINGEV